jgi:hypothetical protein
MQFITAVSAAAVMAATVSARSAVTLNKSCDTSKPHAKIINRCPYEVNLWSVYKGDGCPSDEMVTLQPGETYSENYENPKGGDVGISIKISKTQECKGSAITQLEYFLQSNSPGFNYNYLDVSYVDCAADDAECPTRQEGFFLGAGDSQARAKAAGNDAWCPQLSCWDACSCNFISYVQPDDVQTKTCDPDQNMEFYMCGSEAPGSDASFSTESYNVNSLMGKMIEKCGKPSFAPKESSSSAAPATTLQKQTSAAPKPTETETEDYDVEDYAVEAKVASASVTPAPEPEQATVQLKTKTEVVYVTAYQTVNAKRHAHAHRRHAAYNA